MKYISMLLFFLLTVSSFSVTAKAETTNKRSSQDLRIAYGNPYDYTQPSACRDLTGTYPY